MPLPVVVVDVAMLVLIGIASSSPVATPATIWVLDAPTRPVITGVTVILPFLSTVTVEPVPRELIAALSTLMALLTWPVMTVAVAVIPGFS